MWDSILYKNTKIQFGFECDENTGREIMIIATISFTESPVFNMFPVHTKGKSAWAFSNSSGFESLFEKLRFCDR